MKKTLWILLLLFFAPALFAQGYPFPPFPAQKVVNGTITYVAPIPKATIIVCSGTTVPADGSVCSPMATIYSNVGLTAQATNPTNADANGNVVGIYLAAGSYVVTVSGSGVVSHSFGFSVGVGSSGGGAVSSVTNSDGSLIVTPTTGSVVASLNAGHSNVFTAWQSIDPSSTGSTPFTVNAPLGQIGDILDFELNGTKEEWMDSTGQIHLAQSLVGNAATANSLLATPTQCGTLQVSTGVQANGDANCTSFGGGVTTVSASGTLTVSNSGELVIVDCASACTQTLPNPVPSNFYNVALQWSPASGASQVTIAPNGLELTVCTTTSTSNFNVPEQGEIVYITTDGTNYFAGCPLVAGTNVTMSPTPTGLSVTASTTASTAFSSLTPGTNTNAGFVIASASDLGVELTINGPTAQTSDLQDWNINNVNLASVDHTGVMHAVGVSAGSQGLTSAGAFTVAGLSTIENQLTVLPSATGIVSAQVAGPTGLTADLFDWLIGGTKYDWIDSSGAFHFASAPVMPTGSVHLDQIGSPAGTYNLNVNGEDGEFSSTITSVLDFLNSTAATSGANQSSMKLEWSGSCWSGSASVYDNWWLQNVLASGASANSTLTFTHGGGCGSTFAVSAPNFSTPGQFTSTLASGTPPFVVASTTQVANLDAATAGAFDHTPMQCSGAQVAQGISASGSANCVTPAATSVITSTTNYYVCSQANGTTCGSTDTGNLWHGNATASTTIADTNNCTAVATPCRTLAGVYAKLDPSVPLATQHIYVADNANTGSDCQSPNKMVWSGSTFGLMPMTQSSRLDTWPASYIDIHGNDTTPANVTVDPACGVTTQGAESAIDFDGPMAARVHGFQFIGYGKSTTDYAGNASGPLMASGGAHLYADNNIYTGDAGTMSQSSSALNAVGPGSVVAAGGSQTDTVLSWLSAAYGGSAFTYDPDDNATSPTTLSYTCPTGDSCSPTLNAGEGGTIYTERLYTTVNGGGTFDYILAYLRGFVMYSELFVTGDCTGAGYTAGSGKCNNFVTASTINAGNFTYARSAEGSYVDAEAGNWNEGACTLNVTPNTSALVQTLGVYREYSSTCLGLGGSYWNIQSGGRVSLFTATYSDYSTGALDVPAIQNELMQKSDFTTANASGFQTIGSLSWTVPASLAQSIPFTCHLIYSQATPVSDSFGIQVATNAPTRVDAEGKMFTSLTAMSFGNLADLTTTTATAVVTATPTVSSTLGVDMSGVIQVPSNTTTSTVNFVVSQSTAADVIVVKAGSYCKMN